MQPTSRFKRWQLVRMHNRDSGNGTELPSRIPSLWSTMNELFRKEILIDKYVIVLI